MRRRLLQQCQSGLCSSSDETTNIVLNAVSLMGGELMPSAARAALLRVLADAAASPGPHQAFFSLGSATDRAGHKAVALGFEYQRYAASGDMVPSGPPELWVLAFDPSTGAFLGEEFAYCSPPVSGHLATGKCTAESYAQLLQLKAVASVPPAPPGSTPNTPPVTGAAPASTGAR
jgi:hypothetical protein